MTYALMRPLRFDLESFARAAGLHPELVCRLVALGVLDAVRDASGDLWFTADQITAVDRIQRLRAGLALNYAALGLVCDLLDRIAVLESATRHRFGDRSWT